MMRVCDERGWVGVWVNMVVRKEVGKGKFDVWCGIGIGLGVG